MQILFSINGICISDYKVEKFFQENKDKDFIHISSSIALTRFRMAVKQKEIEPFFITIIDIDGDIYEEQISDNANFNDIWYSEILNLEQNMYMEII